MQDLQITLRSNQKLDLLSDNNRIASARSPILGRIAGLGVVLLKTISIPLCALGETINHLAILLMNAVKSIFSAPARKNLLPNLKNVGVRLKELVCSPIWTATHLLKATVGVLSSPTATRSIEIDKKLNIGPF